MLDNFLDKVNFLRFLKRNFPLKIGLFLALIFAISIYIYISKWIYPHLVSFIKFFSEPKAESISSLVVLLGFIFVVCSVLFKWRKSREIPKFNNNETGILFAPNFPEELEKDIDLILMQLKLELKKYEFGKIFSIKSIPKNISISSHVEATNLLKKSEGTVAVWGLIDRQKSDKDTTTGFSTISFTFVHSPVIVHPLRRKAIAYSLLGKKFQYKEKTKILDRRIMTRDIGIVVCNLIGTALLFDRKFDDAIKVFNPLYMSLKSTLDKKGTPNYLVSFIKLIGFDLAYSLTYSSEFLYMQYLLQNKLFEIPENLLRNWISAIEQAICLDKQNSTHYLVKGIYHFLLGEIGDAINSEHRAKYFAPKALATPNFSLAFLYNFKGNFEKSRREYRLGMAKKTSYDKELIDQCLLFIKQTIDHFPEKKQLHLALGLIEAHRGSLENGKAILTKFLNNPPQEHNLQPFVKQAKELLKSIEEKTEEDQQDNN